MSQPPQGRPTLSPTWSAIAGLFLTVMLRPFLGDQLIIWLVVTLITLICVGLIRNKLKTGKWIAGFKPQPPRTD
jgi:hypothetical protein